MHWNLADRPRKTIDQLLDEILEQFANEHELEGMGHA